MKFDTTKIVILLIVVAVLGVAGYFGYKAIFKEEKLDFNFTTGFKAVAYNPISTGKGEEGGEA
jgi:predicted negative regulator of RcsB-dependent stress response